MSAELRNKAFSNMIWRFLERIGAHGVAFVVEIILARLIAPEAFGIIALVVVFTSILQVFVDSGLGNALIQKKNADDLDFSSVFYYNGQGFLDKKILKKSVFYRSMSCHAVSPVFPNSEFSL